ncbi:MULTISPECIES: hypothetical protein [unclassified Prochlorococcus]|nr:MULTISPECIES: hypothetical protein [unclassified Prochlorococcus]
MGSSPASPVFRQLFEVAGTTSGGLGNCHAPASVNSVDQAS